MSSNEAPVISCTDLRVQYGDREIFMALTLRCSPVKQS